MSILSRLKVYTSLVGSLTLLVFLFLGASLQASQKEKGVRCTEIASEKSIPQEVLSKLMELAKKSDVDFGDSFLRMQINTKAKSYIAKEVPKELRDSAFQFFQDILELNQRSMDSRKSSSGLNEVNKQSAIEKNNILEGTKVSLKEVVPSEQRHKYLKEEYLHASHVGLKKDSSGKLLLGNEMYEMGDRALSEFGAGNFFYGFFNYKTKTFYTMDRSTNHWFEFEIVNGKFELVRRIEFDLPMEGAFFEPLNRNVIYLESTKFLLRGRDSYYYLLDTKGAKETEKVNLLKMTFLGDKSGDAVLSAGRLFDSGSGYMFRGGLLQLFYKNSSNVYETVDQKIDLGYEKVRFSYLDVRRIGNDKFIIFGFEAKGNFYWIFENGKLSKKKELFSENILEGTEFVTSVNKVSQAHERYMITTTSRNFFVLEIKGSKNEIVDLKKWAEEKSRVTNQEEAGDARPVDIHTKADGSIYIALSNGSLLKAEFDHINFDEL